jgi:OOP family OmpA-OmpF porin
MTKASRCLLLIALAVVMTSTAAQQPTGRFYVGAGGGQVRSKDYCGPYFDTVVVACDNATLAYKVFGGVQLLDFLAVETGYADLGEFTSELEVAGTPVNDKTRVRGPLLEAVVSLPIAGGLSVLGKAGGIYWSLEQDFVVAGVPQSDSNSGVEMVLGLGAQYQFNRHFAIRAEYEYFPNLGKASETGDTDLTFFSLSALMRF